jgi:hypothetical protein
MQDAPKPSARYVQRRLQSEKAGPPSLCDPSGKCTPVSAVAPPKPPSKSGSSCGSSAPGAGATAIGEESCSPANASAPPPGATTVRNVQTKGPTTSINGQTRTCFGYDTSQNIVATDCSTTGVFVYLNPPVSPEASPTSDKDQGPAAPARPLPRPVSAKAECPEFDQFGNRCVDPIIGSEPNGDWTTHKVEIENRCECTCKIGATTSEGRELVTTVGLHSNKTDINNRIVCAQTSTGGCAGFQKDVTYACHR